MSNSGSGSVLPPHRAHPRTLGAQRYVYAVLSRRAGGISIGVNLSPHKACNFDCTYCQVDRTTPGPEKTVDLGVLRDEVRATFDAVRSGALAEEPRFAPAPPELRRVVDVAFSGDGEPTSEPWFADAARIVAEEHERAELTIPVRLITNATNLHVPRVAEALRVLDARGLDVWAKLDAGTEAYYATVDRTRVPFQRVLANVLACARERVTTIQALFARHHGEPPPAAEISAWAERLRELREHGARLGWVQVHTVSRPPAESFVAPLTVDELERIAAAARAALPGVRVETYRGAA
jgi:wyosine [tRNA(Phe)-imidazoG37] synthetase (radical SAM superfamily)